jgi:hypothetical protein
VAMSRERSLTGTSMKAEEERLWLWRYGELPGKPKLSDLFPSTRSWDRGAVSPLGGQAVEKTDEH